MDLENSNAFALSFDVVPTDPANPLSLTVKVDHHIVWHSDAVSSQDTVVIDINDHTEWFDHSNTDHILQVIMNGKQTSHTVVNEQGDIVSDTMINIANMHIDGIDISNNIHELTTYSHDYNGSGTPTQDTFYGLMGCNGVVELKFSTPIYIWLLEKL